MNESNRNIILAVVLSALVLIGWEFFIVAPQQERARQQALIEEQQKQSQGVAAPATDGSTTETPATPVVVPGAFVAYPDRAAALAASPDRVLIDTEDLKGSINLTGGKLDDLELKKYFETLEHKNIITLLNPSGAPGGYFVEQGWWKQDASGKLVQAIPAGTQWTIESDNKVLGVDKPVTIKWDDGAGLVFHRTFSVDAHYLFTVSQTVDNSSATDIGLASYSTVVREGTPTVQNFFVQHEGPLGVLGSNNLISKKYTDLQNDKQIEASSTGGWVGFTDKYWATAVLADPADPIKAVFSYQKANNLDLYKTNFTDATLKTVAAGGTLDETSYIFAGAKEESVIASYETSHKFDRLELLIDWGWLFFLTKPMFYVLTWLYGLFGNFGVAVLALTVIVKALFLPLANRSYASMAAMRRVQPEVKAMQERFKDDRAAQQQAMMELYKKEKINPLAGCWPVLIQIPVFFSLYTVIFISLAMRQAPFFGWIQDLAAQDPTNVFTLFGLIPWDPTALPVVGHFLHLGIWPLVMGCTMWVQMRLNPPPPDPAQAAIFNWMPVIFTFMLGTFPAGLVIYWSWNNFLSVCQQYFIMRRHGADVNLFGNILQSLGLRKAPKATT